jgi:hypothetical protein
MCELKGNFEITVLRVSGDLTDSGISEIAFKRIFDVLNAIGDVVGIALGNHFYGAIGQITDEAGEPVASGDTKSGETKADTLNTTFENYMFSRMVHFQWTIYSWLGSLAPVLFVYFNIKQVLWQDYSL